MLIIILVTAVILTRGNLKKDTPTAATTADKDGKPADSDAGKTAKPDTKSDDSKSDESAPAKFDKNQKSEKKQKHVKSDKDADREPTDDSTKKAAKHPAKTKPVEKFGDLDINKVTSGDKESSDPKPKKPAKDFGDAPDLPALDK